MQIFKIAWLAGIIDGEGCFSIFNRTNKSKNGSIIITPTASITITNSNKALIEECISILEDLKIKYVLKNPRNSNIRLLKRLDIRNYKSIQTLINAILPYIIGKKEQAILMKEFVKRALMRERFRATDERLEYPKKMSDLNKFSQSIRRDYTPNTHH